MPAEMIFCCVGDTMISEAELCQKLADGLGIPHSDIHLEGERRFVLGETGIAVSLVVDENHNPMVATADISINSKVEHVTRLCKTFREMGWVL
ncbi:MAG: hypothetical protein H8E44_44410 [Planctomycetes bacterium]|nr:hypothetical protein [Planctomycetota bacterium]MBL7040607.1 hypothetical protein [Pirellulaceae bacterium]